MIKEELEKLIDGKPDDVKAKGVRLFNAYLKTNISYSENPSSQNLKNMKVTEEALEEFRRSIQAEKSGDIFKNVASIVKYLEEAGWKISEKSLYRHINKERKLLRQPDGTFSRKAVDDYAKAWLNQIATGKRKQTASDELQYKKLDQELKNITLKNEREQFNFDKDKGLYIRREQIDIELAMRAGVFISGLKHWIQSDVADWIESVGGDTKKAGELISKINNGLDEHINQYAGNHEYEGIIEEEAENMDSDTSGHEGGNPGE
jgi:hypothetical protein